MPEPIFVGRQQHIEQFNKLLHLSPDGPRILNLRGPGGVGKTKILQQFAAICDKDANIIHSDIVDFYVPSLSSRVSTVERVIAKTFANALNPDPFAKYWELRKEFEALRTEGNKQEATKVGQQLKEKFADNLAFLSEQLAMQGKRIVLLFDTVEEITENLVGSRLLNEWLPRLSRNAVVVLSGRQKKTDLRFPKEIADKVTDAPVDVFSRNEAITYLKKREVFEAIEEDGVTDRLLELTKNRPLLLALSADWIYEYTSFGGVSPKDLVKNVNQDGFERKLVEHLPRLDVIPHPEREILPFMAHIHRPFDAKLLTCLIPDLTKNEANKILKNLSELSFVKEHEERNKKGEFYYWLQDEMRALFHKYVFSQDSSWTGKRKELSQQMIEFYNQEIETDKAKGKTRHIQGNTANRLYHEVYLNQQQGFARYRQLFKENRGSAQIGYLSMLVGALRLVMKDRVLNDEYVYQFRLDEVRWLRDIGSLDEACWRGQELLKDYGEMQERVPYIYNALGGIAERMGKMEQALEYYQKSRTLSAEQDKKERLAREEINMGEIQRILGDQKAALEHFKRAYQLAMQHNRKDKILVSKSFAELGYTYALLGKADVGLDYCHQAVDILHNTKEKQEIQQLARNKVLRSAVYRLGNEYENALIDIKDAINLYSDANRYGQASAYFHLGFTQWFQAYKTKDSDLLKEAEESFKTSISLAKEYNKITLPKALNQISNVYWEQGEKAKARENNQEAYELALKTHDIRYAIDSLLAMAEFDYDDKQYQNIPGYAQKLQSEYEEKGYKFPLFYGRMRRIQGDIALENKIYTQAVDYYAEGLYQISQHGGYAMYGITEELKRLEDKLAKIPSQKALKIYQTLRDSWKNKGLEEAMPKMISWVDRAIGRLMFQI